MKKFLICFTIALFLLTGCKNHIDSTSSEINSEDTLSNSSETSEHVEVLTALIGSGNLSSSKYDVLPNIEVQDQTNDHRDPNLVGTKIQFQPYKYLDLPLTYNYTFKNPYRKQTLAIFESENGRQNNIIDVETGKLASFLFLDFPEGYDVRTSEVTTKEAKQICHEFLETYFPEINLNEWELVMDYDYETHNANRFGYLKYICDIEVESLHFELDNCGNIYLFSYRQYGDSALPEYADASYIGAAKKRIEEFYDDKKDVTEISEYELTKKTNAFINSLNCNAIKYTVSFTVSYADGTKERLSNVFYLPYDETGKAITVELNETVDK
jgi:hypothetical protein